MGCFDPAGRVPGFTAHSRPWAWSWHGVFEHSTHHLDRLSCAVSLTTRCYRLPDRSHLLSVDLTPRVPCLHAGLAKLSRYTRSVQSSAQRAKVPHIAYRPLTWRASGLASALTGLLSIPTALPASPSGLIGQRIHSICRFRVILRLRAEWRGAVVKHLVGYRRTRAIRRPP